MKSDASDKQFQLAYQARLKAVRESKAWTAEQMATALDIPPERYRKYETRSILPVNLLEKLSLISGRDMEYLVTGKSRPVKPFPSEEQLTRALSDLVKNLPADPLSQARYLAQSLSREFGPQGSRAAPRPPADDEVRSPTTPA